MTLVVKYRSTRVEVLRAHLHAWRRSSQMKVKQLLAFGMLFIAAQSRLDAEAGWGTQVLLVTAIAAVLMLISAGFPQRRYKPGERTLRIGPEGISTTIESLSGDLPWTKVARITPVADVVYIVSPDGNSLAVPDRAFSSPGHREEFIELATRFMNASRGRTK